MLLVSDDFILDLFSTINKLMDCLLFTRLYDRILTYLMLIILSAAHLRNRMPVSPNQVKLACEVIS